MRVYRTALASAVFLAASSSQMLHAGAGAADTPRRGGILNFVVGSKIPSYDAHRENTFGVIHPIRPFYSLLLRVNPDNPRSTADIVCDLCEGRWKTSANGKTYTFDIRRNVKFHDGAPLTAADIKASLDKIIFPPKGIPSNRRAWYAQVNAVEAPEKYKLVIRLKRPLSAIIPALASPFNFIYAKKDLDAHGYDWHKTHINGTGAFRFVQHQAGAFVEGRRNDDYFVDGRPFLDGYKAILAPKMSVRLQAIRGNRAAIEFRGFPPRARDDLVKSLGDKIRVQECDWNVLMGFSANQKLRRFQDVRVRKALALALDRWESIKYLQKIAIVKTVGGIVFPGHRLAAQNKWLRTLPGYGKDIEAARSEAKALLREAGRPNLKVTLWNRAIDQPYKILGTWLIDQWRRADIDADQKILPTGPFIAGMRRTRDFDVSVDFNAQTVVNPTIDVSKWVCDAGNNYSNCKDGQASNLYFSMLREENAAAQFRKMRAYEKHVLADTVQYVPLFWWRRIVPHRRYVKGWKIAPSHYLNQALDTVWIDPTLR